MTIDYQDANGNSELGVSLVVARDQEDGKLFFNIDAGNDGASYTVDITTHRDELINLAHLIFDAVESNDHAPGFDGYTAGPWVGDEETGEEICY